MVARQSMKTMKVLHFKIKHSIAFSLPFKPSLRPSLTLLTCITIASNISPLKGLKTMALYLTGYKATPLPVCNIPSPMLSIVVTAITKPCLEREKREVT